MAAQASAPSRGRSTLDFLAAQADARRRTALLIAAFAVALVGVIAFVYAALLVADTVIAPRHAVVVVNGHPYLSFLRSPLLWAAVFGTGSLVGLGTAYHASALGGGGGEAVAELLGGRRIARATPDPAEQRLVNVAEEMAIAAGLPVPGLYVLDREQGINAFAAGYTPGHCVVAVTRGALDQLTRDELQGVVAHEIAHVLHADTRIDLQLMAAIGGLGILSLIGRVLVDGSSWSSRSRSRSGRAGGITMVGAAFLVAGAFGVLCGKLVRFAVARQREWLADASAVQFTRNPDGLASALRKVSQGGSYLVSPYAPEAAHLFFARGIDGFILNDLFTTHPPIEERIRKIAPQLGAQAEVKRGAPAGAPSPARRAAPAIGAPALAAQAAAAPAGAAAPVSVAAPGVPSVAATATAATTTTAGPRIARATAILDRIPPLLKTAAREPFGARALACGMLLGVDPSLRTRQLDRLAASDAALAGEVARLAPALGDLGRVERMALLALCVPALDGLSAGQGEALGRDLRGLADTDGRVTPFELAVERVVQRRLARGAGAPPRPRLRDVDEALPECLELLANLAWLGTRDPAAAQAALTAGAHALGVQEAWRLPPRERLDLARLDRTLSRLDEASLLVKGQILDACMATAAADATITADEMELLRAVSAALGMPMPHAASG
jgi:Zn-dependent protease with chaperone function